MFKGLSGKHAIVTGGSTLIGAGLVEAFVKAGATVTWSDDLVSSWMGEQSTALGGSDIALVVTLHSVTDPTAVLKSAPYVFDTTGKVKGAVQL
jgi:NAD(P)-dependent dehydrogenase (short-subunit alcohol dehydrogenase family)